VADLVIITGASRGLGLALAQSVPFSALVTDISRSGPPDETIQHITADLSDPLAWADVGERVRALILSQSPTRCVYIHAAGILTPIGFAGEVDTGAYTENVLLNSAAGQVLGHHFLRAVQGREGQFDLVMISSGAASRVYPGWSSYGAAKAALDQWVRNVGAEQSIRGGVRVSAIVPGVVSTDMQREIRETAERDFPDVERFRDLEETGDLADPRAAADRMWTVIESGMAGGSVVDVRASS
jgi:benzil reductase ((S)-benzoin forming)